MPFYSTNAHEMAENYQKSFFSILLQRNQLNTYFNDSNIY